MADCPNIIFIVIDTLRKDYAKPLEDALKKFGFISYENVITPYPGTLPAHASILTGMYPLLHGAHESKNVKIPNIKLKKNKDLLNIDLSNRGYRTHLISANEFIRPEFGFIGFNEFHDILWVPPRKDLLNIHERELLQKLLQEFDNKIDILSFLLKNKNFKILGKLILNRIYYTFYTSNFAYFKRWPLEKGSTKFLKIINNLKWDEGPLFIFVNLMEVHEPYSLNDSGGILATLKSKVNPKMIATWQKGYQKQVKYILSKLIKAISIIKNNKKAFNDSLIIVTSDHGQLLGEGNRLGHGIFLDDELLKVPLLIKYPKNFEVENNMSSGYISLISLKDYILDGIDNGTYSDNNLYSSHVFSEVYGIPFPYELFSERELDSIRHLDKYRIAIYYKNFKGVFNVTDWKFEEIISYDPNTEVTEDIVKHMKKEVVKFLKTATVAKVPKIKI